MIKEEQLELIYYFALELKCPLSSSKTRSVAHFALKGLETIPSVFSQLKKEAKNLFDYVKERKQNLSEIDCQNYLAWKIWQYKMDDIDRRILNNYCRCKAQLIAQKALAEFHKSASRIKRNSQQLEKLLVHEQALSEVNQLLTAEIKQLGAIADV